MAAAFHAEYVFPVSRKHFSLPAPWNHLLNETGGVLFKYIVLVIDGISCPPYNPCPTSSLLIES